jgi:hypothetical protein
MEVLKDYVLLAGALAAALGTIRGLRAIYRRTLGRRAAAQAVLLRLAPNVRVEYFVQILGEPPFRQTVGDMTEDVFVDDLFFVQTWTTGERLVVAYSVTTRRASFRPRIPFPNEGRYHGNGTRLSGRLLRTSFSDAGEDPQQVWSVLGARRFWYREAHYLANPGNYQWIALSITDAGAAHTNLDGGLPPGLFTAGEIRTENTEELDALIEFRRRAAPNTYTVSAPHYSLAARSPSDSICGPDHDHLRVFEAPMRLQRPWSRLAHLIQWRPSSRAGRTDSVS